MHGTNIKLLKYSSSERSNSYFCIPYFCYVATELRPFFGILATKLKIKCYLTNMYDTTEINLELTFTEKILENIHILCFISL
jgi:hypothetical protein